MGLQVSTYRLFIWLSADKLNSLDLLWSTPWWVPPRQRFFGRGTLVAIRYPPWSSRVTVSINWPQLLTFCSPRYTHPPSYTSMWGLSFIECRSHMRLIQNWCHFGFTIWLFNIAMENDPFIDDFPIKTTIYSGFSMAMLVITRGYQNVPDVNAVLAWLCTINCHNSNPRCINPYQSAIFPPHGLTMLLTGHWFLEIVWPALKKPCSIQEN